MRFQILLILMITIICFGCSKSKEILIDNPLSEANEKEDLIEARERVERTKHEYKKCVNEYSADDSRCIELESQYQLSVEKYVEIQKQQ